MLAISTLLLAIPAAGVCLDLEVPSGVYAPETPVCARDEGSMFAAVPECAPVEVSVVDGCLGFEPVAGLLDEKVAREGRSIVRQLIARDACSSGWEIRYRLDPRGQLRAEVLARSRCQHVSLTRDGGLRALKQSRAFEGEPLAFFNNGRDPSRARARAALARLLEDQDRPEVCRALSAAAGAPTPLPRELLAGARAPCLAPVVESLLDRPALRAEAERALLRIHADNPGELRGVLLRSAARGQSLLEVARALRTARDEHRVLKGALLGHVEGPAVIAASLDLLELFPERAPAWLADRVEGLSCQDAAWTLGLDEVRASLEREHSLERRFTPLLDPRKSCEPVRVFSARALAARLAHGRPAQPAGWRVFLSALDEDPSPRVRRAALREARSLLQCGTRSGELLIPAFALDALLRMGVRVPCAELPPAPESPTAEDKNPEVAFDPDDVSEAAPPPPAADDPDPPFDEDDLDPEEPGYTRPTEPEIKPLGREETQLGFFGVGRLYGLGGVGGLGVNAVWFVDKGFGFSAAASLGGLCVDCFTETQVHRRDLRFDLGLVLFPFPEFEVSPYGRASFVMGDAEIGTAARTAASFLIGIDAGVGVEWLLSDDILVFFEGTGFLLGEAEQSFRAGVPSAPGIAPLGQEQVGAQLRFGMSFRL